MKIVINSCYGGFGLSPLASKEYLKLKGKKAYFYNYDYQTKEYTKIPLEEAGNTVSILTKDCGDKTIKVPNEEYFYDGDMDRSDPDLVKVVEKLGKKANGMCAELTVVEIPDGVDWEIDEYDGLENVEEKHRRWS
jgi:hypothetical protein